MNNSVIVMMSLSQRDPKIGWPMMTIDCWWRRLNVAEDDGSNQYDDCGWARRYREYKNGNEHMTHNTYGGWKEYLHT